MGIHLCRDNFACPGRFSHGSYDRTAVKVFKETNANTYLLDCDTVPANGLEPFEELASQKNVIFGGIVSKFPELEDLRQMCECVFRASDFVDAGAGQTRDRALQKMDDSPQCRFASHNMCNRVTS